MDVLEEYVARVEETCGEEKDFVVVFRYDKKDEVITKILDKTSIQQTISQVIFELTFGKISFRLYGTGKAIFRKMKDETELKKVLANLLV